MTMTTILRLTLAVLLAALPAAMAAQGPGSISGKATDEAKQPYTDYEVLLRDPSNGQPVTSQKLDTQGRFSFTDLAVGRRYIVELWLAKQGQEKKIVCTEGPYTLATTSPTQPNVNIDCGKTPAALWLLAAGAGAAALVAFTTQSPSR